VMSSNSPSSKNIPRRTVGERGSTSVDSGDAAFDAVLEAVVGAVT
jgi:hypothetical protein